METHASLKSDSDTDWRDIIDYQMSSLNMP